VWDEGSAVQDPLRLDSMLICMYSSHLISSNRSLHRSLLYPSNGYDVSGEKQPPIQTPMFMFMMPNE